MQWMRHLVTFFLLIFGMALHLDGWAQDSAQDTSDVEELQSDFDDEQLEEVSDQNVVDPEISRKLEERKKVRTQRRQAAEEQRERKIEAIETRRRQRSEKLFFVGVGAISTYLGETSKTNEGKKKLFFPRTLPTLVGSMRLHLAARKLYLSPTATLTPLGDFDGEDGATARIYTLGLPLSYEWLRHGHFGMDAKFGPGLLFYWINGLGGTVKLNNGNTTSTFYNAGLSSTASMYYLGTGLGFVFGRLRNFRIVADVLATGFLSSNARTFSTQILAQMGIQ